MRSPWAQWAAFLFFNSSRQNGDPGEGNKAVGRRRRGPAFAGPRISEPQERSCLRDSRVAGVHPLLQHVLRAAASGEPGRAIGAAGGAVERCACRP